MLNKTILKSVLNVKHTIIENIITLGDTAFEILVHPTKHYAHYCGVCGRRLPIYDHGRKCIKRRNCSGIADCLKLCRPNHQPDT